MALATASDLDRAQALARSLAGGRYIWGGVSRAGSDCSGFLSILINAVKGRADPFVRLFATGNWSVVYSSLGFRPGLGATGDFSIGLAYPWELTSGIGHCAGTLGGLAVEARGGRGVLVGAEARSAENPLFRHHFHLPISTATQEADMPLTDADKPIIKEAMTEWWGGKPIAPGQTTAAGTVEAILTTAQSLVNLANSHKGTLANLITDKTTAVLAAIAALPTDHLTDEDKAEIVAALEDIDSAAVLDALHARLAA